MEGVGRAASNLMWEEEQMSVKKQQKLKARER